ncbi:MAG: sulfurtransferase TusA family protein [Rhodospirillales bacterium]|nr:sulfurtransferase TusA family protein [Rhodospirillales bacterium]
MSNRVKNPPDKPAEYYLDISGEVCPLTFVRTKLLIEKMAPGETAVVLLRGAEPVTNVPRAVAGQGHELLELQPLAGSGEGAVHRLRFRKVALTNRTA